MGLLKSLFIGAAAGAVVAYFLKRNDNKLLNEWSDNYSEGVKRVSEGLKAKVDGSEKFMKDGIDKVSSKLTM